MNYHSWAVGLKASGFFQSAPLPGLNRLVYDQFKKIGCTGKKIEQDQVFHLKQIALALETHRR
jgi:hypothetical protein